MTGMVQRKRRPVRRQYSVPSVEIAAYAIEFVHCLTCGAEPGVECDPNGLEYFRTCCKSRFTDAALAVHRDRARKSA